MCTTEAAASERCCCFPLSGESEQGARCYGELAQKSVLFLFFFFSSTPPVVIDVAHRFSYHRILRGIKVTIHVRIQVLSCRLCRNATVAAANRYGLSSQSACSRSYKYISQLVAAFGEHGLVSMCYFCFIKQAVSHARSFVHFVNIRLLRLHEMLIDSHLPTLCIV